MKQAQTQKVKTTSPTTSPSEEIDERPKPIEDKKLSDDIDSILDEIDEVLEENAEEFVTQYVQKGGQ